MTNKRTQYTFKLVVTAMTLWLLSLVLWSATTQQARSAQTATHATKIIFMPTTLHSVNTPKQAITVLKAASLSHTIHK